MFTFQKTLKCVFEAYHTKELIFKSISVCKNATYFASSSLKSSTLLIDQNVSVCTMPRVKSTKSQKLALAKFLTSSKKGLKRKSKKRSKSSKKKCIVSEFVEKDRPQSSSSNSDIVIVFDSTENPETITIDGDDTVNSNKMGNANGEIAKPLTLSGAISNVQDAWSYNNLGWGYGSGYIVNSQQCTNSELFETDQNCVSFSRNQYRGETSSWRKQSDTQWRREKKERRETKVLRNWSFTNFGQSIKSGTTISPQGLMFTLLSYNVLAQDLLEGHMELYQQHKKRALQWSSRSELLLREIQEADADIMCLQEVQASHLNTFYRRLLELGYDYIYKKRTGDNVDGVAIFYKTHVFDMVYHTSVEYFQPGINVLDRHNVGLIAKLAVKGSNNQHIVVATTHLLFNPRRHDVKLAQMQILLTEVERLSFHGLSLEGAMYWPVIITGDMNFKPHSGVYRFLTEGSIRYEGLYSRTLSDVPDGRILRREFLPRRLDILDTCQHWGLICKRLIEELNHMTELKHLKIHNTDHQKLRRELNFTNAVASSFKDFIENAKAEGFVNNFVPFIGPSSIPSMPKEGFATGQLTHSLNLQSVYSHNAKNERRKQATTNQGKWVTVDYIFYSPGKMAQNDNLQLVGRYELPNVDEAASVGPIPNMASPSDHYPLLATFYLQF